MWGLSAAQLHDAYWHARGVQCIRRGMKEPFQRAAELYLLIEPDQLVLFHLASLSDRLTWNNAAVTRLRLTDANDFPYSEHVVVDDAGYVQRIERRYRPRFQGSTRVVLTPNRRIARIWMASMSRREGWDRVRRAVPWSRVDHLKCAGMAFDTHDPRHNERLLKHLVEHWTDPGRSIKGIEESEKGVWHITGQPLPPDTVRIGPLWLGYLQATDSQPCMIGPAWVGDEMKPPPSPEMPAVRDIIDVEWADQPRTSQPKTTSTSYAIGKRLFDVVVCAIALILASPLMIFISLLIMMEDGLPIFYGQRRLGRQGRQFQCWKFRSMHRDADQLTEELEAYNVCDGPQVYIRNDPRVTRIGRYLRITHLDELPQLINVLLGQMSIVGPRPSPDDEIQFCPGWRDLRLSVRPGITGLWQLYRTREPGEDFQEWIKYDIEYVQQANFALDVSIMFRTVGAILFGRPDRASDKTR